MRLLACAALLLALPPPAAAEVIPFAPLLDHPYHLHVDKRDTSTDGGQTTVDFTSTSDEELVFSRSATGIVLRWTTLAIRSIEGQADRQAETDAVDAAAVGRPVLIRLDAQGTPQAIANLAETRRGVADAIGAASTPALARLAEALRSMPDAQLEGLLTNEPHRLLWLGGADLAPGHPAPLGGSVPLPPPFDDNEVPTKGTLELRAPQSGVLKVVSHLETDPAAVDEALPQMAANPSAAQAAALLRREGFRVVDDDHYDIDARTGLPLLIRLTRTTRAGPKVQIRSATYELHD